MQDIVQWGITTALTILGILAGRMWERYDRRIKKDQVIYEKLLDLLPSNQIIEELRFRDFGGPFPNYIFEVLDHFEYTCTTPEFFFLDSDLERKKKKLEKAIYTFEEKLALHSYHLENNPDAGKIYTVDANEMGSKYQELRNEVNLLCTGVINSYDDLIKSCRRKL